jgi:hypothetical protein
MAEEKKQTTREIMDKIYAMTPEEFNRYLAWHFDQLCNRPIPSHDREAT